MEKATEETTTQPEADTDADAGKHKRGDNESEQTEYKKQAVPGVLDNAAIQAAIAKAKQAAAVISSSMMGSGTPQMSASVGALGSPAPSRAAELPPAALPPVASPASSLPASVQQPQPVQVPDYKLQQYFDAHPDQQESYQDALKNGEIGIINAYRQEVLNWEGIPGVPVQPPLVQVR